MEHPHHTSGTELRTYLAVVRRRRALILLVTLAVSVLSVLTSSLKTPMYTATAKVLLRTGDPTEQINQTVSAARLSGGDADRYLTAQLDVVESEIVAEEAAKLVKGARAERLLGQVDASQAGTTDIIAISAADAKPERAAEVANAFVRAYVENRRLSTVAGVDRASQEIEGKLNELVVRIADLDARIEAEKEAAKTAAAQKAAAKKRPAAPAPAAETPPAPAPEEQFTPTENMTLTAARSAATLQYETLYAQQQTLLVNKSLKKGEAEVIVAAKAPASPSSPKPKRALVLGFVMGLLLGLGGAILREQLDDRIQSREHVEELTSLPVLAEIPLDAESVRIPTRVSAEVDRSGNLAEAARSLRTSLMFLGAEKPLRRIVVTSAGPQEGKSFLAANLAAVYAQAGLSTVLVSADLRRPRLESMFPEVESGPGLSELIAGLAFAGVSSNGHGPASKEAGLASALRWTHIENLFLLPSGEIPPNPAELLSSKRASEVLDLLSEIADIVVVDAPPALVVTDAALLAASADGVILVAAAKETHPGALARAAATLSGAHARLLGVVLNKVGKSGSASYYGYGRYGPYSVSPPSPPRFPWLRRREVPPSIEAHSEPAVQSSGEVTAE
jgi:capsular exopolysaccharide synthesis family protein